MQIVQEVARVPVTGTGNWVAIGKWDGMHLGHQAIVQALVTAARRAGGQSIVLGFEPLPMAVLRPSEATIPLQPVAERADLLAGLGVDIHLVLPFTKALAATPAAEFAQAVLLDGLAAREVMVGFNHTFGRGGRGTAQTLTELCGQKGVPVRIFSPVRVQGETISSTAVRYLLTQGDVAGAAEMLGRPFSLSGTVITGDRRGRTIGYPTANLDLANGRMFPATGVYAVQVAILPPERRFLLPGSGVRHYGGMLNLGCRPTFGGQDLRCEVYLFDYTGDLYGQRLQVEFIARLRSERNFAGLDQLVAQLDRDAVAARAALHIPIPGK